MCTRVISAIILLLFGGASVAWADPNVAGPSDPRSAFAPQPTTGSSVDIRDATNLQWSTPERTVQHDVYFGQDQDAIQAADRTSPQYRGRQSATSFPLAGLVEFGGGAYYWRIDEVEAGGQTIHTGSVWSFIVPAYLLVDDFESYNDTDNCIFDTWIDGYANKLSGSTVGNFTAPFAEQTVVHGGKQSMPLDYDNTKAPFFSETVRTFSVPQDWTGYGVTDLSLWFRGYPAGFAENGDHAYTVSGSGADIGGSADAFRFAYKKLTGDGSITARLDSQTSTEGSAKAGVMIRETLEPGSAHAAAVVTPAGGVRLVSRWATAGPSVQTDPTGVTPPCWVRLTRAGNLFQAEYSAEGKTWAAAGTDALIPMGVTVYIGLAVTAHDAASLSTAQFSHVSLTGGVWGLWQARGIGSTGQPGNDADTLYLALEDSAGYGAVVTHPDPAATLAPAWTQWRIPLTAFIGVNLAQVQKLYLGIGDANTPTLGGAGRLFLDDLQVLRP